MTPIRKASGGTGPPWVGLLTRRGCPGISRCRRGQAGQRPTPSVRSGFKLGGGFQAADPSSERLPGRPGIGPQPPASAPRPQSSSAELQDRSVGFDRRWNCAKFALPVGMRTAKRLSPSDQSANRSHRLAPNGEGVVPLAGAHQRVARGSRRTLPKTSIPPTCERKTAWFPKVRSRRRRLRPRRPIDTVQ